MEIVKAKIDNMSRILNIYEKARKYMKENENPNQWLDGYPKKELILEDIKKEKSFLCIKDNEIQAVFYFDKNAEDPTYKKIYKGNWLNNKPYGVVHRIAVDTHEKGIASYCIDWCMKKCKNLKIDTHEDNIPMQKMLEKNEFVKCGIIYLEDGSKRVAYQKTKFFN